MSLKKKGSTRKKSSAPIKVKVDLSSASSIRDIDRVLAERHERFTESGGYRLRTGKVIPISKHYREKWILLKEQPKTVKGARKDYLYHGTIDTHLSSIKKYGLMISDIPGSGATKSSAWDGDERHLLGYVSLTDLSSNAATYGLHAGLLSGREGNQVIFVIDRTKLDPKYLVLTKSGAPPAKEWAHAGGIPPDALVGYWHNIGKVKLDPAGVAYVEEAPPEAIHKGWVYYSNPAYRGELD
jgi:hypothetical protein